MLEMLGEAILLICALLIVISRDATWLSLTAGTAGLILTCTSQHTSTSAQRLLYVCAYCSMREVVYIVVPFVTDQ
jgi:hypothetical protein